MNDAAMRLENEVLNTRTEKNSKQRPSEVHPVQNFNDGSDGQNQNKKEVIIIYIYIYIEL